MNPAKRIIEKFGGHRVVAGILGLSVVSVYRFTYPKEKGGTGGLVPSEHVQTLLTVAPDLGVDLSASDFFESPEPQEAA